jgi:hypothetical protein
LKTFFIFAYIGDNNPNWLCSTTNQILFHLKWGLFAHIIWDMGYPLVN